MRKMHADNIHFIKKSLTLLFLLVAYNLLICQKISVKTNTIAIGDKIELTVESKQNNNADTESIIIQIDSILCENFIEWKEYNADSIGDFDLLQMDSTKCKILGNKLMINPSFEGTTKVILGAYSIGEFKLTKDIKIAVMPSDSVLLGKVNEIMDIKPILIEYQFPWKKYLLFFIFTLVLIFGLYKLYEKWKNKSRKAEENITLPKVLLEDELIAKLQKIKLEKTYLNMEVKDFQSELIDILKKYFTHRYKISFFEMTTKEVLLHLKKEKTPSDLYSNMDTIFNLSDMVKFAKAQPNDDIFDKVIVDAIDFIRQTRKD